jgi:hypothetical protein
LLHEFTFQGEDSFSLYKVRLHVVSILRQKREKLCDFIFVQQRPFILPMTNTVFSNNRIRAGRQGAAIRAEQPKAISDIRTQTTARDAPGSKSNKSSFILTEVEPLLLLLFGLLLFSEATGIKLKLLKR